VNLSSHIYRNEQWERGNEEQEGNSQRESVNRKDAFSVKTKCNKTFGQVSSPFFSLGPITITNLHELKSFETMVLPYNDAW
jgi:hypothetical protein